MLSEKQPSASGTAGRYSRTREGHLSFIRRGRGCARRELPSAACSAFMALVGARRSGRHLVEESEDGADLVVAVDHRDVEADHERLGSVLTQTPGETRLPVMCVDGPHEAEGEPGELALHSRDGRVDGIAAVRLGQGVDVAGIASPDLVDQLTSRGRVSLVPAGEIAGGYVTHGSSFRDG